MLLLGHILSMNSHLNSFQEKSTSIIPNILWKKSRTRWISHDAKLITRICSSFYQVKSYLLYLSDNGVCSFYCKNAYGQNVKHLSYTVWSAALPACHLSSPLSAIAKKCLIHVQVQCSASWISKIHKNSMLKKPKVLHNDKMPSQKKYKMSKALY